MSASARGARKKHPRGNSSDSGTRAGVASSVCVCVRARERESPGLYGVLFCDAAKSALSHRPHLDRDAVVHLLHRRTPGKDRKVVLALCHRRDPGW